MKRHRIIIIIRWLQSALCSNMPHGQTLCELNSIAKNQLHGFTINRLRVALEYFITCFVADTRARELAHAVSFACSVNGIA